MVEASQVQCFGTTTEEPRYDVRPVSKEVPKFDVHDIDMVELVELCEGARSVQSSGWLRAPRLSSVSRLPRLRWAEATSQNILPTAGSHWASSHRSISSVYSVALGWFSFPASRSS